jgi:hypothetical protein
MAKLCSINIHQHREWVLKIRVTFQKQFNHVDEHQKLRNPKWELDTNTQSYFIRMFTNITNLRINKC